MNAFRFFTWSVLATLLAVSMTVGGNQRVAAQRPELQPPQQPQAKRPSADGQDGVEVLTRGPVHEAFAETITFDPEPGVVALQAPPADIEEVPPLQKPAAANLAWIPGYWAWDDERNDFLWLSGIWRALPPGRQWVPGYWGQNQQGYQWTSGYWADAGANEVDYLPEPPATVEAGPNVAAPSADDIWLPGSWIWQQNRYAWRPGYWTNGNQDWDWVPDHYVWTPRGYVFVDGYYDYSVPRRGIVFAPVYFDGGLRTRTGFSYTPSTVINPGVFVSHLFVRPGYGHYYFGDYYGSNYANSGFSPWFAFQSSNRGYDPIYANQRWQNRRDRNWEQRAQVSFQNLRDNENGRPPRTWAAQRALTGSGQTSNRQNTAVAEQLDELANRKDAQLRLKPVDPVERQQFSQRGQEYRKYLQQRQSSEAANAARTPGVDANNAADPARRKFANSPYVGPSATQLGRDHAPPQRHEVLKPDLQVQPQPRVRSGRGTPGTQPGLAPGASGGKAQQIQVDPQRGSQRQGRNLGDGQGASNGQSQVQGGNRGDNRQGASNGRQQQGASNGPQQRGAGDQQQDTQRAQSTNESKKRNKN